MVKDFKKIEKELMKLKKKKSTKTVLPKTFKTKRVLKKSSRATLYLEEPEVESTWNDEQRFFKFGRGVMK